MNRKSAFTLVELLVVVAIIAVLVSILLPALGKARQSGQKVGCQSNLRQIGTAFLMYCDDFNEYVPPPQRPGDHLIWDGAIAPYLKQGAPVTGHRGVLACPGDKTANKSVPSWADPTRYIYEKRSYAHPWFPYYDDGSMTGTPSNWIELYFTVSKLSKDRGTWKTALATDLHDESNLRYVSSFLPNGWGSYLWLDNLMYGNFQGGAIPLGEYHQGGQNYVMLDGHVANIYKPLALAGTEFIWYLAK